jgi:hypothetical protein
MSIYLLEKRPSNPRRSGKVLLTITILLASVFPLTLVPNAKEDRPGKDGQLSGKQGQVLWIEIPVQERPTQMKGKFLGREIRFFPVSPEAYGALLGIDMNDPPGSQEFFVNIHSPTRTNNLSYTILVMKEDFPVQRLTLPKDKVDLDQKTLVRVRAEQLELKAAFDFVGPHPLWEGAFIEPTHGRISGRFGSRRIINGQSKNPHSGEDIAAPSGTAVAAMNTGVVRLTIDHFFTGKGVILDHGVGLYSMYFHLSETSVRKDQLVKKGQTIGKVGSTGRATGPHLHWGVRLNGSRINPYSLTNLPIPN